MNADFKPTSYRLECLECGKVFEKDNHLLSCDEGHSPSLLRADYRNVRLSIKGSSNGMFIFKDWLPLRRYIKTDSIPVVFKSEALALEVGLENLWIVFSGYWPERGANMKTCTFKELEAPPVCSRLEESSQTLVVASAGNTARAFAELCSVNEIPLLLVVHEAGLDCIWSTRAFSSSVRLVAVTGGADYLDAIQVADMISKLPGYIPEGGAKNVARRDGMGTALLAAALEIGRIPDHYFQAVGSGTGGIAAWEASERLVRDGRYGSAKMKLHLAQNYPFTPMTESWKKGSRILPEIEESALKEKVSQISAHVLSNRKPPYGIRGGVFDALTATNGLMYSVTNEEASASGGRFEELEGIDLDPAAAVALGALKQAFESGSIDKKEVVLLNITGGGKKRLYEDYKIHKLEPHITLRLDEITQETIERLF
ncbi:cysteate synthase [bacterium]|nr:cysteate synthase [bacterium]